VVLDPQPSVPVVGLGVHYAAGFRSERPGRGGFAHLFEHLMFQGSENVGKMGHFRLVEAAGGVGNASTHFDFTEYYQAFPPGALERVIHLEADRMRAPRVTAQNIANQIAVVKEEIALQVTNRPYGGFPWTVLPGVLYSSFANAHNGYGCGEELEGATVEECEAFFAEHYRPSGAVVTLTGGFDPGRAADFVERHFGDIPGRPAAPGTPLTEAPLDGERHGEHQDPHAPLPALAIGHRMPDPAAELDDYLAHMVLAMILCASDGSRLRARLVRDRRLATDVRASCGFFGPLLARDPDTFVLTVTHRPQVPPAAVVEAVDEELAALADAGPTERELAHSTARCGAAMARSYDDPVTRTRHTGAFELLHGRAGLVPELAGRLASVSAASVTRAAKGLRADARAVLTLVPGARP
jgi:predicted Zn-dependent peptidase